nr:Hsp20/alpha crystallin family protein [bacterium]
MYLSTVCNPARVATFNFESLFGSLFDQANHRSFGFKPGLNIRETEEQYEISMALPGFSKKDVSVEAKDAELVVRHEAQESGDNGDGR